MATISTTLPSDGSTIDAADVNTPLNAIITQVNGNIDVNNLADAAVTPAKLLAGTGATWAWQSWTPTLSGQFTDGDWTKASKYMQIGKTVFFRLYLTAADATPMAGGAGGATFTLPVTSVSMGASNRPEIATGILVDDSGNSTPALVLWTSTTTALIQTTVATGTPVITGTVNATTPFTWTTTDVISVRGFYEAA